MTGAVETALVVDDDFLMRDFVVETLRREHISVTEASSGLEACNLLEKHEYDVAFIDLKMPGMGGMELLKHMCKAGLRTLPIIVTAFGTVEKAVEAVKCGAYDFLMKPFSPEQVSIILNRARELVQLRSHNSYLQQELGVDLPGGRSIIGKSDAVQQMMGQIERVAATDATVLISGESGTGKELVALAIHAMSERKKGPFVRLNCAAVPESLVDSELFGHEKGAFTSAVERRMGRFELADGGTLLLDEVSEMDLAVQAKLLRVLQEREFERVGGSRTIRIDTRVIAATNRNLEEYAATGNFRSDLFYRLNVVPIHVPPLRERREDIPLLIERFVKRSSRKIQERLRFSEAAVQRLVNYDWPGNIRELENVVEHMCVMSDGPVIEEHALPPVVRGEKRGTAAAPQAASIPPESHVSSLKLQDLERETIVKVLKAEEGNRGRTAEVLGVSVRTLRNKINQYRNEGSLPPGFE